MDNLSAWLKQNSTVVLVVVIGLVVAVIFIKRPSTATGSTSTATGDYSGLSTDASGMPIIYRVASDTNINSTYTYNETMPVSSASGDREHPIEPPIPDPRGISGESNNFWVYTIKPGDTLNSITAFAGWTPDKQSNGGPGFLYNYRNNGAILKAIGADVQSPNTQLPAGYQISL